MGPRPRSPFTRDAATRKVRAAEDAWNSRHPHAGSTGRGGRRPDDHPSLGEMGAVAPRRDQARLASDAASRATLLSVLSELGQAMRDASICGLGQTASSAVASAMALFDPFPSATRGGR